MQHIGKGSEGVYKLAICCTNIIRQSLSYLLIKIRNCREQISHISGLFVFAHFLTGKLVLHPLYLPFYTEKDQMLADKDNEILKLKAELEKLKNKQFFGNARKQRIQRQWRIYFFISATVFISSSTTAHFRHLPEV